MFHPLTLTTNHNTKQTFTDQSQQPTNKNKIIYTSHLNKLHKITTSKNKETFKWAPILWGPHFTKIVYLYTYIYIYIH